jgi:deazaflavin-dependent oxidoreductase (nitroreductase family)
MNKGRIVRTFQKYVLNPLTSPLAGILPGPVLLETTGRRSRKARRNPVGATLEGDRLWIVAEHGRSAAYVRNILADPRVRVRVRGAWRPGVAHVLPDDDPIQRLRRHRTLNNLVVRIVGTDLLTIRIDLEV